MYFPPGVWEHIRGYMGIWKYSFDQVIKTLPRPTAKKGGPKVVYGLNGDFYLFQYYIIHKNIEITINEKGLLHEEERRQDLQLYPPYFKTRSKIWDEYCKLTKFVPQWYI